MKKYMISLVLLVTVFLVAACGNESSESEKDSEQNGEKVVVRIAGGQLGPDHSLTKTFNFLKEKLETDSGGQFDVQLNVAGELGEDREIIQAMQTNQVQLASPSPAALGNFNSSVIILDMPFLFTDRDAAYETLDSELGQMILDELDESGLKGLGYYENGFRNLTNNVKPINTIEDLKGLSIRTMENTSHIKAWELLGANPTPMSIGELYTALQQGTVDGQENPFGLIATNKFYEVQKYLTVTNHVYSPNIIISNEEFFNGLPTDLQDILTNAIKESVEYNRELAMEEEKESRALLEEEGMEVTEFSQEDLEKMQEITKPVYEEFKDEIGEDIVDAFLGESN